MPEPLPEKHAFFEHRGYEMCIDEHYDLEADVTQDPLIDAFDVSGFTSYTAEPLQRGQEAALFAFLQAEFPGRWLEEMQSFLGSGGNPEKIMLLCPKNGAVCGFCKISVNPQGRSGWGPSASAPGYAAGGWESSCCGSLCCSCAHWGLISSVSTGPS